MTTPTEARAEQAQRFAKQIGVDPDALVRAASAVWSNMNPQSTHYDRALSIAGVALLAANASGADR